MGKSGQNTRFAPSPHHNKAVENETTNKRDQNLNKVQA